MSQNSSQTTNALVKFLKGRVESQQGISLEALTGHLSQLPPELTTKYGCSANNLKDFLRKYPTVFKIRKGTNVYVATNNSQGTSPLNSSSASVFASASHPGTKEEDITSLSDVKGTVYRLFPVYGFISTEAPISATIYFDVRSFENARHTTLPSSGLQVDDQVIFDANIGPRDCKAKYRATRVIRAPTAKPSSSPAPSPENANDEEEVVDCGTFSHRPNQYGVVEIVKLRYGFIKFGPDESERAFFHANNVDKSLRRSMRNLSDMFSVSDKVRFDAKLSMKPSENVKWEATAVYLCRGSDCSGVNDSEKSDGNDIFMSDDESGSQNILDETREEAEQ